MYANLTESLFLPMVIFEHRRIEFLSNNDKSPGLTIADQTGTWILESCGRCGEIQCSHGLPELHKV